MYSISGVAGRKFNNTCVYSDVFSSCEATPIQLQVT